MRFRMRCNLKTAPNIGELSLVSAIGPLLEWNVPVLPMARRSRSVIRFDGQICDLFELFRETATLKCYGESQTALGLAYLLCTILSNLFSYRPS